MINEKTFNKIFNAVLLIGMTACVTVACVFNLQKPDARVAKIFYFGSLTEK